MKVTKAENELIWALREVVDQNCDTDESDDMVLDSGFIRAHAEAFDLLVKYGHAEYVYPPEPASRYRKIKLIEEGLTPNAHGRDVVQA